MHSLLQPALLTSKVCEWLSGGQWVALNPDTDVPGKAMKYMLFAASFILRNIMPSRIIVGTVHRPQRIISRDNLDLLASTVLTALELDASALDPLASSDIALPLSRFFNRQLRGGPCSSQ